MADGTGSPLIASTDKRGSIICAAARVFMARGFGAATMDDIAAEAGVSKQTVYSHFGSKNVLFEEIVHAKCAELMGQQENPRDEKTIDLQALVYLSATRFIRVIFSDDSITLFRTIVAESVRFPELAEAFYRVGPKAAYARLASGLQGARGADGSIINDPQAAAEGLYAMLRNDLYMKRLLGLSPPPSETEVEQIASDITQKFLAAYATAPDGVKGD
jgi:TetR/AcrR family transcriptional repressor of mexJK operon